MLFNYLVCFDSVKIIVVVQNIAGWSDTSLVFVTNVFGAIIIGDIWFNYLVCFDSVKISVFGAFIIGVI